MAARGTTISKSVLKSEDTGPLLRRLFADEGRRHVRGYLLSLACMAVAAAMTGLAAALLKNVVNQIFIDRYERAIYVLGASVVTIYLIKGLASYGSDVIMARIGGSIIANVQSRMFRHLLGQDMQFFNSAHSAEFIARNSFVALSARNALALIIQAVGQIMTLIGLITVVLYQDLLLAVLALIFMPVAILGSRYLSKRVRGVTNRQYGDLQQIMNIMQETGQGVRVVKSFTLEETMRSRMDASIDSYRRAANKIAELGSRSGPIMETIAGIAVATVIVYGGWRVVNGGKTPGELVSFIGALMLAYDPAKRLAKLNVDLNNALVGVRMYFDFLDSPGREARALDTAPPLAVTAGRIEFSDVVFGYREGEPVLRGMSFVADGGRTTALVGQSGGGKSTVLAMILRFYDPQSGRVTIDGQDIAGVSLSSLRHAVAYVSQDVFLFSGSIRDNIEIGKPGASDEEIIAAAKAAHAHDFISDFEHGYDAPVGERGLSLSGGQRARIAIARAILKDAPVILLDEATAALDSESEVAVQTAIDRLCAGRTVIVVAHRLQTIQRAHKICVIEEGRVVEEGHHDELLARRGRYFLLHSVQFREEPARPAA